MSSPSPPTGPPRAILTEINGILVEDVWGRAAQLLADETGVNARTLKAALDDRLPAFERSGEDWEAFFREITLETEIEIPLERFTEIVLDTAIVPVAENLERLRALRSDPGVRIIAVSNIPGPMFEAIDRKVGLSELFDDTILSYREGMAKPNQQVYIEAIDRAGMPPGAILYLDSVEEDVAGAVEWGLRSVRIERPQDLPGVLDRYFGS
jgi:HAD superfamily hydrolase (TIGR01549 family)